VLPESASWSRSTPIVHRIDFLGLGFLFVMCGENSLRSALGLSPSSRVRSGQIRFGFSARNFFELRVLLVDFLVACTVARFYFSLFGFHFREKIATITANPRVSCFRRRHSVCAPEHVGSILPLVFPVLTLCLEFVLHVEFAGRRPDL
jgi:hypothetical protein